MDNYKTRADSMMAFPSEVHLMFYICALPKTPSVLGILFTFGYGLSYI